MAVDITSTMDHQNMIDVLSALVTDVTAAKTAIDTMATKLNADAGVTDTNYAAMAALTTTI